MMRQVASRKQFDSFLTCISLRRSSSVPARRGIRSWPTHRRQRRQPAQGTATSAFPTESRVEPVVPVTKLSGPYREVLLASKCIRHHSHPPPHPHITTHTTKLHNEQLSAADKFFSHPYRFLYSAEALHHHSVNHHVPEIVVLGSSNVGKSTFLNALVGSSTAARVSQKPGRTTLMNVYGTGPLPKLPKELVSKGMTPPKHSLLVVDTPGYGFRSQATWGDAIVKYLRARSMLKGAVVLLSSEKDLMPGDEWMLRTLAEANMRTVVVLTKADKSRNRWVDRCDGLMRVLETKLDALHREFGCRWRESSGHASQVYITAAGIASPGKLRNAGGMGGVKTAILDMAGFTLHQDAVSKKAEAVAYTGPIISFEDLQWTV